MTADEQISELQSDMRVTRAFIAWLVVAMLVCAVTTFVVALDASRLATKLLRRVEQIETQR